MTEAPQYEAVIWQYLRSDSRKRLKPDVLAALEGIAKYGDRSSIFPVTGICLDESREIREKAWRVLDQLLAGVPVQALPKLDTLMRSYRVIVAPIRRIHEVRVPTCLLGMLSFSFDGFVREAAVRQLVERFDGKELPFILIRINDWVDVTNEVAVKAVQKRLSLTYGHHFVENLPLLRSLWGSHRHQRSRLLSSIEYVLKQPDNQKSLLQYLSSNDRIIRRYAFELLIGGNQEAVEAAISTGLSHKDVSIRLQAVEAAVSHYPKEKQRAFVAPMLKDRFAPIRKEALRWLAMNRTPELHGVVTDSLLDHNGGVRDLARDLFKEIDAQTLYMKELRDGVRIESALRGLVEIKASVPIELMESFLSHPQGKVRAVAYAYLLENKGGASQLIVQALFDPSGSCAREVHKYIVRHSYALSRELLWELFGSALVPRAKRTIIYAISKLNKWESLALLLRAKTLVDRELRDTVDRAIAEWIKKFNRSFTTQSAEQLEACRAALRETGEHLSSTQRGYFEFLLK